jgi:DNA-binding CsgD family transcriptional regulator
MQVRDLSELVLQLTGSAVERRPQEHQAHVIDLLHRTVRFDAAWWGWSNFASGVITLVNTSTHHLSAGFESAFRAVAGDDPFIRHGRNLTVFAKSIRTEDPGLSRPYVDFLQSFDITAALNGHCRLRCDADFNFFMSLYRTGSRPGFADEETSHFAIILQHLEQSLSLSLRAELRTMAPAAGEAAILSANGLVAQCTRGFRAAMAEEFRNPREMQRAMVDLAAGRARWSGRTAVLTAEPYSAGLTLLRAAPVDVGACLSAAERRVTDLLLSGLSMRQVADSKGVSLNTVRNQVAAVYRKTGARGKLDLARRLGLRSKQNV